MKFFCIDDEVPAETIDLLREACDARSVEFVSINALLFDYDPESQPVPGDLMYRPAVSAAAMAVEEFMYSRHVATFYSDILGPFFHPGSSPYLFAHAGLPVPRTFYVTVTDPELLRSFVGQLGGFPVVLKVSGGEGGVGVMRADSYPSLFSICDFALSQGQTPILASYVPDATHWRVIVIGTEAVAAYKNIVDEDDFRTYASENPSDYTDSPDPQLSELAVKAVQEIRTEFAGVDVLEHQSGRKYLLEANFPCYLPQAQIVGGIDIAGAMLGHLMAKARLLADTGSDQ